MKTSTLVLTAQEVTRYLPMAVCIDAVEAAFLLLGRGQAQPPVTVGLHAPAGGFHIKAAVLDLGRRYFAVKANGNFPSNPSQHDLPTIQGLVILCDGDNGKVLAVMDSIEITARRTAAATAVAAKYLAPRDAEVAAVCGCGVQAAVQLAALAATLPIERFITVDAVPERAQRFASDMRAQHGLDVRAASFADAVEAEPDVWVTCTTSREFFLFPEHVKQGAFVAGVGVDNEVKRELAPTLIQQSYVVTDRTEQCEKIGDLHHAIEAGVAPRSICELGEIVAGRKPGRSDERAIYVFDSTGIAIQDVAAAAAVFEAAQRAREQGASLTLVQFGD